MIFVFVFLIFTYSETLKDLLRTDTIKINNRNFSRTIKGLKKNNLEITYLGGNWKSFSIKIPRKTENIIEWLESEDYYRIRAAYAVLSYYPIKEAEKYIIKGLSSEDIWIKWDSLVALEKLRDIKNAKFLLDLVYDNSPTIRKKAIVILGEMKYEKAKDFILYSLLDENEEVRGASIFSLYMIFPSSSITRNAAIELLNDRSKLVKKISLKVLTKFKVKDTAKPVGEMFLKEKDVEIKRLIADLFLKWHSPLTTKYLITGIKDKDKEVREKCKKTLDIIQKSSELPL